MHSQNWRGGGGGLRTGWNPHQAGRVPEAVGVADERPLRPVGDDAGYPRESGSTPGITRRFAPRVLIVDDDATTGETLARLLTLEGFKAFSVQSGAEGLQRALSSECDALVLDLHLQDLPGLSLLAQLRARDAHLPVIPITGKYLDEEHRRRAEGLGISAYLHKPLIDDALIQALRRATGLRGASTDGSIGAHSPGTHETLASVLPDVKRLAQRAYPRMPREAVVDAVHDAAIEFLARGDIDWGSRRSQVARLYSAAWRNLANTWRSAKRRRVREEEYVRMHGSSELPDDRDASTSQNSARRSWCARRPKRSDVRYLCGSMMRRRRRYPAHSAVRIRIPPSAMRRSRGSRIV